MLLVGLFLQGTCLGRVLVLLHGLCSSELMTSEQRVSGRPGGGLAVEILSAAYLEAHGTAELITYKRACNTTCNWVSPCKVCQRDSINGAIGRAPSS